MYGRGSSSSSRNGMVVYVVGDLVVGCGSVYMLWLSVVVHECGGGSMVLGVVVVVCVYVFSMGSNGCEVMW